MIEFEPHLIKRCLKRDRRAQNELYRKSYDLLMAISWRYADDKEEAIEYVNTAFLKVLTNLKKYKQEVPFELWMRRVAINEVIDQIRKKKRYREKVDVRDAETLPEGKAEAKLSEIQEDKLEWIRSKTKELPNVTARVFNLYAFDGFKHAEIAKMLDISEGTSQWHYSMAKQKLKEWSSEKKTSMG